MTGTPQDTPPPEGRKAVVVGRIEPQKVPASQATRPTAKDKAAKRGKSPRPAGGYRHVRPSIAVEFQPDAVEIEEAPPPRLALYTLYALLSMLLVFGLWASIAEIDRVVSTRATIMSTASNVVLQPLEVSVLRGISVKSGDIVRKGEVLATLDPTFTNADTADLESRKRSFDAELRRLQAEVDNTPYVLPATPTWDDEVQHDLYRRRLASYQAQLISYEQDIARAKGQLATAEDDIRTLTQRLQVAVEIERMRDRLRQQEVGSQLNLLIATNERLEIRGNLERARNSQTDAQHMLQSTEAKLKAFVENWRQESGTKLVTVQREANQVNEQLNKARLRGDMVTLAAPMDGIVLSTIRRSAGAVVQQGDVLVSLVPLDAPAEVEIKVPPSDIGFLTLGDRVRVKLDAYPYIKHGTVEGKLIALSHDTVRDQNDPNVPPFYLGRAQVVAADLIKVPDNFQLIPGMTAIAEVMIGKRSVLSYLLYPILGTLDTGLRDSSL